MKKPIYYLIVFLVSFNVSPAKSQNDSGYIISKNNLGKDLQRKLSGVRYSVMNTTKEEIDILVNQRDYQDLYIKLSEYLKENLGIAYFAFTETQRAEIYSKKDLSACDIVEVAFDPGKFNRTLGALGVYRHSSLMFGFCDGTKYKVELSDISVDGYSYHPNRFAAAFKRIQGSKISYNSNNSIVQKHLTIYKTKEEIDSLLANSKSGIVGEYKSLGMDKNTLAYQVVIVGASGSFLALYTGGASGSDWLIGELKAELTPTKSDKIFLGKWYTRAKTPVECTFIFEDENSFQVKTDSFSDRYVRIR